LANSSPIFFFKPSFGQGPPITSLELEEDTEISLEDELTDELDTSFLLLEESPDFTELELLESDEFFVSFAELLDTSAGSEPLTLLEDLSLVSLLDPFDSADAPLRVTLESGDSTDELETPVSSELADEESSQAERAKNAANTATHKKPRPLTHFIPLSPVKFFTTHKPSNVKYGMWNLYRKIHHQTGFELFKFVLIYALVHIFLLLTIIFSRHNSP
jgi:hypothetical protein